MVGGAGLSIKLYHSQLTLKVWEGQQVIKFGIIIKCCCKNQTVTTEAHIMLFLFRCNGMRVKGKFALTNVSKTAQMML